MRTYRLVTTKTTILITFTVFASILVLDYFFNLHSYHSIYQNLLFIISIFTLFLFGAISIGLYYGIKLKDNVGKITNYIDLNKIPDMNGASVPDLSGTGEGINDLSHSHCTITICVGLYFDKLVFTNFIYCNAILGLFSSSKISI